MKIPGNNNYHKKFVFVYMFIIYIYLVCVWHHESMYETKHMPNVWTFEVKYRPNKCISISILFKTNWALSTNYKSALHQSIPYEWMIQQGMFFIFLEGWPYMHYLSTCTQMLYLVQLLAMYIHTGPPCVSKSNILTQWCKIN